MQTKTVSNQTAPNYAPSVPISVYRDLAEELQVTKAKLESVQGHNKKLVTHNEQLRQEIEKVVQSTLQLEKVASVVREADQVPSHPPQRSKAALAQKPKAAVENRRPAPPPPPVYVPRPQEPEDVKGNLAPPQMKAPPSVLSEEIFTEQEERRPRSQSKQASDMGGLWLGMTILLIVLTAFGAGFLIVRPLLPTSR